MNLYEIKQELLDLVDQETGEVADWEKFDALNLERDTKIENIALWIKNLNAEADAYEKEKKSFEQKEKQARNKANSLTNYLSLILASQKQFKTTKVNLTWRKSKSTVIENEDALIHWLTEEEFRNPHIVSYPDPVISKTAVKEYMDKLGITELRSKGDVVMARIVEHQGLQVK